MTFDTISTMWILSTMAVLAVLMEAAAAAGDATAPSPVTNTVTSQDKILLEWLKITAVPLGVFLLGACTWGCIKNSVVWKRFTLRRGESNITPEADEVRPAERPIDSSGHSLDLEVGLELSHRRMNVDLAAMSAKPCLKVQHPPQTFPTDGKSSAPTGVAPCL